MSSPLGGSWRGPRGGRVPRGRGSGGHPSRALCHEPQTVAQPPCGGRRWRRRGHGNAILLLKLEPFIILNSQEFSVVIVTILFV